MKKDITELYTVVDDFCKEYERYFNSQTFPKLKKLTRTPCLEISEMMTIILLFHQSPAKNFKFFYSSYLTLYKSEFPTLPSYNRFIGFCRFCRICKKQEDFGIKSCDFKEKNDADIMPDVTAKI